MADADLPEIDGQDQSEMFDEDVIGDEGLGPSAEMRVFEELPDVYDVTTRQGDADLDDDLAASDADEIEDDELDDIDLEDDDGEDDDSLDDDLEDVPEDNALFADDDADLDEVDGVDDLEDDEAEIEAVGDVDGADDADKVSDYESEQELSRDDVEALGYAEEEEVDEDEDKTSHGAGLVPSGPGTPAKGHSGEAADLAADRVHADDMDEMRVEERQDRLLDEGIEETFPASDPVSVKRIT